MTNNVIILHISRRKSESNFLSFYSNNYRASMLNQNNRKDSQQSYTCIKIEQARQSEVIKTNYICKNIGPAHTFYLINNIGIEKASAF